MTGTNDIGTGQGLSTSMQSMQQLHAVCHEMGVQTVALAPTTALYPQPRAARQALAEFLASFAATSPMVLACVDVEDLLPGKDGKPDLPGAAAKWERDGVHMSRNGSLALGRQLA